MEVGKFLLVLFTLYCFSIISFVENKTYLLVKHQDNGDDSYASTEPTKVKKTPNSSGYRTQDISKQTKHKLQKFYGHKFLSRDETKLISAKECSEKITALKNEITKLNKELAAMNELANSLASSMSDAKKIPGTQNENPVTVTQPPKKTDGVQAQTNGWNPVSNVVSDKPEKVKRKSKGRSFAGHKGDWNIET